MSHPLEILVVTHNSNMEGSASSHHIDDRLPHFTRLGAAFRVLTSIHSGRVDRYPQCRVPAPSPREAKAYLRRWIRKRCRSAILSELVEGILFLPLFPFYLAEKAFFPAHRSSIWWFVSATAAGSFLILLKRPDVVYTTGGDNSAHLAGAILCRVFSLPWVAEFQDPLVHGYCAKSRAERRFVLWLERTVLGRANRVVFLTDEARRVSEARTGSFGKGVTIYPGADAALARDGRYEKDGSFDILHVGSFAGSRSPETFLVALRDAVGRDAGLRKDVRFHVVGRFDSAFRGMLSDFPHEGVVVIDGVVPRQRAVAMMGKADLLLLVQNREDVSMETIPSKTYEYLHSGRPILALVYRNREIAKMLEGDCHSVVEMDDEPKIREAILSFHRQWRTSTVGPCRKSPYTTDRAVARLMEVLHEAAEGAPG